ncbi:MAG: hypothetical protein Q8P81_04345 [Nanoarchaeota archaeon]|nr:hypothetical protein [Nanoarchaeota archaeon]
MGNKNVIRGDLYSSGTFGIIKIGDAPVTVGLSNLFGIGVAETTANSLSVLSSSLYLYSNKSLNLKSGSIVLSAHTTQATIDTNEPIVEIGYRNSSDTYVPSWFITHNSISSSQRTTAISVGTEVDAGNAIGSQVGSSEYYTTAGAKLLSVVNGTGSAEREREYTDYYGTKVMGISEWTGSMSITYWSELLTLAAAASTDTVNTIPVGSLVIGVSARVVTVIPTATWWGVGTSASPTAWGDGIPVAANNTNITGSLSSGIQFFAAATPVTITPNVAPGAATGQVRVEVRYITITPPQA